MPETSIESRIALEMVRITEAAAIDSARHMGRGDNVGADRAATEAMRRTMDELGNSNSWLQHGAPCHPAALTDRLVWFRG